MMFAQHVNVSAMNNAPNDLRDNLCESSQNGLKRRRTDGIPCECGAENGQQNQLSFKRGRMFVHIPRSEFIFHTEAWKPEHESLYLPLTEEILVNMSHVDQISFDNGAFFVANSNGEYQKSLPGFAVHFWRHDTQQKSLVVARSFLITNPQIFAAFRECLESM